MSDLVASYTLPDVPGINAAMVWWTYYDPTTTLAPVMVDQKDHLGTDVRNFPRSGRVGPILPLSVAWGNQKRTHTDPATRVPIPLVLKDGVFIQAGVSVSIYEYGQDPRYPFGMVLQSPTHTTAAFPITPGTAPPYSIPEFIEPAQHGQTLPPAPSVQLTLVP